MNRVQAIKAVADKIGLSGPFTNNLVDAMVAVGAASFLEGRDVSPQSNDRDVDLDRQIRDPARSCCRRDTRTWSASWFSASPASPEAPPRAPDSFRPSSIVAILTTLIRSIGGIDNICCRWVS
jgi:hypothetical protein